MTIRRDRGMSLIEVIVAAALLGLLVTMVYSMMANATDGYSRDSARQTLNDNARRILDEIAQDLRDADAGTLIPGSGDPARTDITFRKSIGFKSGETVWSSNITYKYEAGVSGGRIVRVGPNAGGKSETIRMCENVKPPTSSPAYLGGFQVSRTGDRVVVSLTMMSLDRNRKPIESALQTTISLRNTSTP